MPADVNTKSLTVRFQPEVYRAAAEAARKRGRSLNTFIQESVQASLRVEEDKAMYEAATILGEDAAGSDVEFAFAAQREVVLNNGE